MILDLILICSEEKLSKYDTHDPAPALNKKTVAELREVFLDEKASLFDRYRAMFALRNAGNEEAVLVHFFFYYYLLLLFLFLFLFLFYFFSQF